MTVHRYIPSVKPLSFASSAPDTRVTSLASPLAAVAAMTVLLSPGVRLHGQGRPLGLTARDAAVPPVRFLIATAAQVLGRRLAFAARARPGGRNFVYLAATPARVHPPRRSIGPRWCLNLHSSSRTRSWSTPRSLSSGPTGTAAPARPACESVCGRVV